MALKWIGALALAAWMPFIGLGVVLTTSPAQAQNVCLATAAPPAYVQGTLNQESCDLSGNLRTGSGGSGALADQVQGNSPSGATDVGSPVKIGGVFMTTPPAFTNGQRGDAQIDASGNLRTRNNLTVTTSSDAVSNGQLGLFGQTANIAGNLYAGNFGFLFNGATWDRLRSGGAIGMQGVNPQATPSGGSTFAHIATSTTTTAKSGSGTLYTLCVNTLGTVASTTTVYDSTTGSGSVIAIINTLNISGCFNYGGAVGVAFTTGLTLVTTGTVAPDVTVTFK